MFLLTAACIVVNGTTLPPGSGGSTAPEAIGGAGRTAAGGGGGVTFGFGLMPAAA